jgi:hypothetical protein
MALECPFPCADWEQNISILNAPTIEQQQVWSTLAPFRFCPWCGSGLQLAPKKSCKSAGIKE